MTDARITSATANPVSIVPNGRTPSLLSGAAPDFSGLLQAFTQPSTDETPSHAPAEASTDQPTTSTAEDDNEDQPERRDAVKTIRAASSLAPGAARVDVSDNAADEAETAENLSHTQEESDALNAAIKADNATENVVVMAESATEAETPPNDPILTWLAGQQTVTVPKIAASQKATPAPSGPAASVAAVAPINAAAVAALTQQGAPTESHGMSSDSITDATTAPDFKQPALLRTTTNPLSTKVMTDTAPVTTADTTATSTVLPLQVKSAEPESVRALAAQAVPESAGNQPPPAPPQGIAPVSVAALSPLPAQPKPVESGRTPEQNFSGLDSLGNTRSLNGYQSTAQLGTARTSRTSGLPAAAVVEQVAVKLHQQAQSGLDQLTIQLRPADLGRIDVKLQFHDGSVTGTIIADSQATLDLLQKDQRSLERALQESGLRTEQGSLSFALRDQSSQGQNLPSNNRGANRMLTAEVLLTDASDADSETAIITANRVNLRV